MQVFLFNARGTHRYFNKKINYFKLLWGKILLEVDLLLLCTNIKHLIILYLIFNKEVTFKNFTNLIEFLLKKKETLLLKISTKDGYIFS